jgi:hypothetical protein
MRQTTQLTLIAAVLTTALNAPRAALAQDCASMTGPAPTD